jgi:hypothetical protein
MSSHVGAIVTVASHVMARLALRGCARGGPHVRTEAADEPAQHAIARLFFLDTECLLTVWTRAEVALHACGLATVGAQTVECPRILRSLPQVNTPAWPAGSRSVIAPSVGSSVAPFVVRYHRFESRRRHECPGLRDDGDAHGDVRCVGRVLLELNDGVARPATNRTKPINGRDVDGLAATPTTAPNGERCRQARSRGVTRSCRRHHAARSAVTRRVIHDALTDRPMRSATFAGCERETRPSVKRT